MMAVRIFVLAVVSMNSSWWRRFRCRPAGARVSRVRVRSARWVGRFEMAFLVDQLVEPAHLAVGGLEAELVQFGGVGVEAFGGAGDGRSQALPALLDPATATLEDPHPGVGGGPGEEREMHAEPVVGPGLRPGVAKQIGQSLLSLGGDPVRHPRAAGGQRDRVDVGDRILGGDVAGGLQAAQRRVERTEAERPERAQGGVQSLPQLVAVHRGLREQAEDRELEDGGTLLNDDAHPLPSTWSAAAMATNYIATIHRVALPLVSPGGRSVLA